MVILKALSSMVLTVNGTDKVIKKGEIYELPDEFGKGSYTKVFKPLPAHDEVKKKAIFIQNEEKIVETTAIEIKQQTGTKKRRYTKRK